jgi:hypothetical protein
MNICKNCVMDTTDKALTFDEKGVCARCNEYENRILGWWNHGYGHEKELEEMLAQIRASGKGKPYDCILGLSGGLDSSYMLHLAVTQWGLRPFVFHVDGGWNLPVAEENIRKLCDNEFEELVIVNNDSGQRQRIKNVWSGFPVDYLGRRTTTTPLEPSVSTFKRYVNTFKRALQEAGFYFEKETQDVNVTDVKLDPCFVYLMCDSKNGYHKIGISKTPEYRERTLQSEKPTIEMVCAKEYPSRKIAEAIESALHKVYERERIRGEWFNLSKTDVMMIQKTLE